MDRKRLIPPVLQAWSRGIRGTGYRLVYTFDRAEIVIYVLEHELDA